VIYGELIQLVKIPQSVCSLNYYFLRAIHRLVFNNQIVSIRNFIFPLKLAD